MKKINEKESTYSTYFFVFAEFFNFDSVIFIEILLSWIEERERLLHFAKRSKYIFNEEIFVDWFPPPAPAWDNKLTN